MNSARKPNQPKVLATICARGGSKGVEGKNLRSLMGKPLISYSIECAKACPDVDRVILSTDNDDIAAVSKECGLPARFRRPAEMASDTAGKIDAIRHATLFVEEHDNFFPDIVVDLDITAPLRAAEDVTACIDYFGKHDVDAVLTAYEAERNPYFNMVEFDGPVVHTVTTTPDQLVRRQDAPPVYSVTGSVFAYRRTKIMEIAHLFSGRWGACIVPRERAIDIDHELDFQFIEFIASRQAGS